MAPSGSWEASARTASRSGVERAGAGLQSRHDRSDGSATLVQRVVLQDDPPHEHGHSEADGHRSLPYLHALLRALRSKAVQDERQPHQTSDQHHPDEAHDERVPPPDGRRRRTVDEAERNRRQRRARRLRECRPRKPHAYPTAARERPNLTVRADTLARRVVFEGTHAVGIEVEAESGTETVHAERDVILAAGAVGSPHLLRSGAGPAEELSRHGVPLVTGPALGGP